MWDSGYQVGTNSYWEAEPFDKRKTGKILGYHKCVTFLIQMSFGIPFLWLFWVFFQEHFQKQRIENSMGSSEPTAKQVSYLRTLCSSRCKCSHFCVSRCINLLVCWNHVSVHQLSSWLCLLFLKMCRTLFSDQTKHSPSASNCRYPTSGTLDAPSLRPLAYMHLISSKSTNLSDLMLQSRCTQPLQFVQILGSWGWVVFKVRTV